MNAPVLAFDLDGTLLDTRYTPLYGDPASLARLLPIDAAVQRARALRRQGCQLMVITGRIEAVRSVTELQVAVLLGPGVPVTMQAAWQGGRQVAAYKARALVEAGADLYVGDSWSDQYAAHLANVPYTSSTEFAEGAPLPITCHPAPAATTTTLAGLLAGRELRAVTA